MRDISVLRMSAVAEITGVLFGKGSLKPSPGRAGITRWKGWLLSASSGSVKGLIRCVRARFEKGNGGINKSGNACL